MRYEVKLVAASYMTARVVVEVPDVLADPERIAGEMAVALGEDSNSDVEWHLEGIEHDTVEVNDDARNPIRKIKENSCAG
jgi:hypothetical protein